MKVQIWNCGDENTGMKMWRWKWGDENVGMTMQEWKCREWKIWGWKKAGDEKPGMKVKRWNSRGWSVTLSLIPEFTILTHSLNSQTLLRTILLQICSGATLFTFMKEIKWDYDYVLSSNLLIYRTMKLPKYIMMLSNIDK